MKYRDVEYAIVQGLGRQLWRWSFVLDGQARTGQAATKAEAVAEAERAGAEEVEAGPAKSQMKKPDWAPGSSQIIFAQWATSTQWATLSKGERRRLFKT